MEIERDEDEHDLIASASAVERGWMVMARGSRTLTGREYAHLYRDSAKRDPSIADSVNKYGAFAVLHAIADALNATVDELIECDCDVAVRVECADDALAVRELAIDLTRRFVSRVATAQQNEREAA